MEDGRWKEIDERDSTESVRCEKWTVDLKSRLCVDYFIRCVLCECVCVCVCVRESQNIG